MTLLPCNDRKPENELRFRKYMMLVRRLGTTFILLLCFVFLVCYAFARFASCRFLFPWLSSAISLAGFPTEFIQLESQYQWENLRPGEHCLRYATREYTSRLVQVSGPHDSAEAMKACHETPVEIHSRQLRSDWCQDLGFGRGVYGFWTIDFEEPDCETWWGKFNDLGCYDNSEARLSSTEVQTVEKGPVRRLDSRLENLKTSSNWQIMCATTPAEIHGRHFGSPAACFYEINQGVYGEWDVEDPSCGLINGP